MSHTDIIWIVVTLSFSSTVGVYAAIRYINLHTRPPVNTLVRSGDIELVDYIQPTRPQQIYNYPDLLESHGTISYYYERISDYGRVPSYRSGTLPIYQSIDGLNINCCLENNINLFDILIAFILGVLFFFLVNYCIFKLSKTNSRTVFINGISTEVITFRNNYQEILSSKLNKGDQGFFINYGEVHKEILKYGWTEEDIKVWLESLNEQDYNVTIEILSVGVGLFV